MSAGGWILLLFVLVSMITIIVIVRKNSEERTDYMPDPEPDSKPEPKPEPEPEPKPETMQITVYGYNSTGTARVCTKCDGENDVSATKCCICGQQLS